MGNARKSPTVADATFTPAGDEPPNDLDAGRGGAGITKATAEATSGRGARRPLPPPRPLPLVRVWAVERLENTRSQWPVAAPPQRDGVFHLFSTDSSMVLLAAIGAALIACSLWL